MSYEARMQFFRGIEHGAVGEFERRCFRRKSESSGIRVYFGGCIINAPGTGGV